VVQIESIRAGTGTWFLTPLSFFILPNENSVQFSIESKNIFPNLLQRPLDGCTFFGGESTRPILFSDNTRCLLRSLIDFSFSEIPRIDFFVSRPIQQSFLGSGKGFQFF